jgi:hypothetical protein
MAWILHAIGVTDQKQLYFKMAPQLLEGIDAGLRQMRPTPLASHITSLRLLPLDESSRLTRELAQEKVYMTALKQHRDTEASLRPSEETQLSAELEKRLENYEGRSAQVSRMATNITTLTFSNNRNISTEGDQQLLETAYNNSNWMIQRDIRMAVESEEMLKALDNGVAGQHGLLSTDVSSDQLKYWIEVAAAYKFLFTPPS